MRGPLIEALALVAAAAIAFLAGKSTARQKADASSKGVPAAVAVEEGSAVPLGAAKFPDATPMRPPAGTGKEAVPLKETDPAAALRELFVADPLGQEAMNELELTPDELQRIQDLNRDWRARMSALVRKNLVDLSAGSATITQGQFAIRAFPEEGAAAREEFKESLSALLGKARGALLAGCLNGIHDFGDCGQNSVMIVVKDPPPEWIDHKDLVIYHEWSVDHRSGGGGGATIEQLNERYGLNLQFGDPAK